MQFEKGRFRVSIWPKRTKTAQNTVFPQVTAGANLFLFSPQKGFIIRGRQLFQILLTGSRTLNIWFYYPIKQKIIT